LRDMVRQLRLVVEIELFEALQNVVQTAQALAPLRLTRPQHRRKLTWKAPGPGSSSPRPVARTGASVPHPRELAVGIRRSRVAPCLPLENDPAQDPDPPKAGSWTPPPCVAAQARPRVVGREVGAV